jgi:septum formation protein
VILASRLPRRAELLAAAGIPFEVFAVDVDETPRAGETPRAYVERLAIEKAQGVFALRPSAMVLGADTTVVIDGRVLGKPVDEADAAAMLAAIQGRDHEVLTGVALVGPGGVRAGVASTRVWIAELSAAQIDWYVRSGEPMDKAGAYGIQGLASRFVTKIDGSYTNVVGLPIPLVVQLLG